MWVRFPPGLPFFKLIANMENKMENEYEYRMLVHKYIKKIMQELRDMNLKVKYQGTNDDNYIKILGNPDLNIGIWFGTYIPGIHYAQESHATEGIIGLDNPNPVEKLKEIFELCQKGS